MSEAATPYAFDVFISYSRKNETFAGLLEKALENYRPEKDLNVPQRHIETFRDKEDFTAGDYDKNLLKNLKISSKLIVICSPEARASEFVNDEIRKFVEIRGAEHIIPVLHSGIPNNEAKPGQEDNLAFPDALCQAMKIPLAVNFLDFNTTKDKIGKGIFTGSWYSVLADIYGLSRGDMEQREKRRRARRRRITVAVLSGSLIVLSVLLIFALISRSQAIAARNAANRALLAAYIESGRQELDNNYPLRAAGYLNAAYQMPAVNEDPGLRSSLLFLLGRSMRTVDALTFSAVHGNAIRSGEISRDGKMVATISLDGTAKVWDIDTGRALVSFEHSSPTSYTFFLISLSPDGRRVVTADKNKIEILDLETQKALAAFAYEGICRSVEFSPDGRHVLAAVDGQPVRIWDVETGNTLASFENIDSGESAEFSPDGKRVAIFGADKVKVLNVDTQASLLPELTGNYTFARFSPDGRSILTIVGDSVSVWDTETGKNIAKLPVVTSVMDGEVSPDGTRIVTVSQEPDAIVSSNNAIRVWNLKTGELLQTFEQNEIFLSAHFLPDGKTIATGSKNGTRVRDLNTGVVLVTFAGDSFGGVSADGRRLLTIGDDHAAKVWNYELLRATASLDGQGIFSARFTPDGKKILAVFNSDDIAKLFDTGTRTVIASFNSHDLGSTEFSPDGTKAASQSNDGTIQIRDFTTGITLSTFGERETISPGCFSPDGRRLATVGAENAVRIWDIASKTILASFEPGDVIWSVVFSPDWKKVAIGYGNNRKGRIWDVDSRATLGSFEYVEGVKFIIFSPDGEKILTMDESQSVDLRETRTGKILAKLTLQNSLRSAEFSPNGKRIVTADVENAIKIWDTESGTPLVSIEHLGQEYLPGTTAEFAPAFSQDSAKILVGSVRTIQIRDVETGKILDSFDVGEDIQSAVFSPDGGTVLFVAGDFHALTTTVRIWSVAPETRSPAEIQAVVERKVPFQMVNGVLVSR